METNFRNTFVIALVLALAPACGADAGEVEDGEDAVEAAGDGPDGACGCTVELLRPDSVAIVGLQDLECFCREHDCLTYEESTSNCSAPEHGGVELFTYAGCNLIEVASRPGGSST